MTYPTHTNGRRLIHLGAMLALSCLLAACGGRFAVEVSADNDRIISFAPHITETIFALGAGDRLVAVTSYCDYPPEVTALDTVGDYLNPSLEKLTMLNPGAIFVPGEHAKVSEFARHNAIPMHQVDMDTLDTIREGIYAIGQARGREAEAEALWQETAAELDAVREAVADRPRKPILIITARHTHDLNNLYTVGSRTFIHELAAIAGGDNIYGDADQAYISGSKETVVMRAPEVILEFHAGESLTDDERTRYIADWDQLGSLPAVQTGDVHLLTESHFLRPGPRVADIARAIARAIHPDVDLPEP